MSAVSIALWTVFWILAVFVGSLIISLVIAAFIRAGGSGGQSPDGLRERGSASGDAPPETRDPATGQRAQDEEPGPR